MSAADVIKGNTMHTTSHLPTKQDAYRANKRFGRVLVCTDANRNRRCPATGFEGLATRRFETLTAVQKKTSQAPRSVPGGQQGGKMNWLRDRFFESVIMCAIIFCVVLLLFLEMAANG